MEKYRYRVRFEKDMEVRFTSHLDLHRMWERTCRRASLPLVYSQGFNPRPKLNLASALPLGFSSKDELLDLWLQDHLPLVRIETALRSNVPPGIHIIEVTKIDERERSLQSQVCAATYEVNIPDHEALEIEGEINRIITSSEIIRERRGKRYDLRPLIEDLLFSTADEHDTKLVMTLTAKEGATGRPEEVCAELGLDPSRVHIERTRLILTPAVT